MGTWDASSFGNDTANDWAYELEDCDDLSHIEATLQGIVELGDEYLEAPDAEAGIAAAEVLAWLRGKPSPMNSFTNKIGKWVNDHPCQPPQALVQKAISVLGRIQQQPSELIELWEGDPEWAAAMADLRSRLTQ